MKNLIGLIIILLFANKTYAQNGCIPKLSEDSFTQELKKIKSYDFDNAKIKAIEVIITKCINSFQLKILLEELSFEQDKLDIIKKAYLKVSDPPNFKIIKSILDFEESKKVVDKLMT